MTEPSPAAGWYADPENPARHRYWDGTSWTDHVQDAPHAPSERSAATVPGPRKRRGLIIWVSAGVVVLLGLVTAVVWGAHQFTSAFVPNGTSGTSSAAGSGGSADGDVPLSEADFYQRELTNLRAKLPAGDAPIDPLAAPPAEFVVRASPGYRAAAREYLESVIATVEEAGSMQFETLDAAESYAYSTLGADIEEQAGSILFGGAGTELETRGFPQDPAIVEIEQRITDTDIAPDSDGSYLRVAEELAALVGSRITLDQDEAGCPNLEKDIAAFVCLGGDYGGWGLITYTPEGMAKVADPSFIATMKHEIAHKLIHVQCGNQSAVKWNNAYGEGVANSYAVIYLGADRAALARVGEAHPEYVMNDTTDARARALHESDLACYDNDALPVQ